MLVEGAAERTFSRVDRPSWGRRFFAKFRGCEVQVHEHQGRGVLRPDAPTYDPGPRSRALLDQLPAKLRAYASARDAAALLIVVLVDADADDCVALKQGIAAIVAVNAPRLRVLVRIAVRETEAFYLGDWEALRRAFPAARRRLHRKYRPDLSPENGTWELFAEVIGEPDHDDKVAWAERMGVEMSVDRARDRSPSFGALCEGLERALSSMVSTADEGTASRGRRRRFHHAAKEP